MTMFLVAMISVALGAVITPLGMATSIMSIADGFKDGQFGLPFACKSWRRSFRIEDTILKLKNQE